MTSILIRLAAVVLGLFVAAELVDGIELVGLYVASIVAVLLGLLNLIVRPVLVVLTIPITLLTFGLFVFVINAALFWFVSSFVDGFNVAGFGSALLGSLCVSACSWIVDRLV